MTGVIREALFIKLSMIETMNKKANSTIKSIRTTREATRSSRQTSQVVTQLSITGFNRVGIRFSLRNLISPQVIPETIIGIESITVVAFGFGRFINYVLNSLLRTFPGYFPAQKAACSSIYDGDDVDPVFLFPMNVNSSSISASFTSSGFGASGKLAA